MKKYILEYRSPTGLRLHTEEMQSTDDRHAKDLCKELLCALFPGNRVILRRDGHVIAAWQHNAAVVRLV